MSARAPKPPRVAPETALATPETALAGPETALCGSLACLREVRGAVAAALHRRPPATSDDFGRQPAVCIAAERVLPRSKPLETRAFRRA